MILRICLFFLMISAINAYAGTTVFFAADQSKATILVQGPFGDTDAAKLFQVMNVEPIDVGNALKKQITFVAAEKEKILDLLCTASKTSQGLAACTLQIFKSKLSTIDPSKRRVLTLIQASHDIENLAEQLAQPDPSGAVFVSNDNHLAIDVHLTDTDGNGPEIRFTYQEK